VIYCDLVWCSVIQCDAVWLGATQFYSTKGRSGRSFSPCRWTKSRRCAPRVLGHRARSAATLWAPSLSGTAGLRPRGISNTRILSGCGHVI